MLFNKRWIEQHDFCKQLYNLILLGLKRYQDLSGELKEVMHSICAILNKHQHGELYFVVKPDGTVVGQIVTEESLRDISQKIGSFIKLKIYLKTNKVIINGKECIHVKFEGNHIPYFSYGVARIRVADEDLQMSLEEITELLLKNDREENNLLNAGKTLFSDDLIQDIQKALFATNERLTFNDIQRYHGPVLKLVDIAEAYIKSNIRWRAEFTGSLQRTEISEVSMDAIREALLNSFCHKDYFLRRGNL